jgi:hypothetical protein
MVGEIGALCEYRRNVADNGRIEITLQVDVGKIVN